jgi:DNA-binding Lrp family transcriptional regulator
VPCYLLLMQRTLLFVQIKCDPGYADEVGARIVDQIDEVREVFSTMGPYDLLVSAYIEDVPRIVPIVQEKIHGMEHVRETNTFLSFAVFGKEIGQFVS